MSNITKIIEILRKEYKEKPVVSGLYKEPFFVLISCILSLRTRDSVTEKASERLFSKVKNCKDILKLSISEIEDLIYPVGFYKTKAKKIKEIARVLTENHNGKVPDSFDELLKLNGVGRKTANIVMTYGHFKMGYLPIDTHCHRIPNRLGWINTKNPEQTEEELKKILPKEYWYDFNELFVKHGQRVCVAISPFCSGCKIREYCKRINVKKSR